MPYVSLFSKSNDQLYFHFHSDMNLENKMFSMLKVPYTLTIIYEIMIKNILLFTICLFVKNLHFSGILFDLPGQFEWPMSWFCNVDLANLLSILERSLVSKRQSSGQCLELLRLYSDYI